VGERIDLLGSGAVDRAVRLTVNMPGSVPLGIHRKDAIIDHQEEQNLGDWRSP
jgi:hypothetical protein